MDIVESNELPAELARMHREPNLLWYGPSTLLVAKEGDVTRGVVRSALREHSTVRHGLIADLMLNNEAGESDAERAVTAAALIAEAERRLLAQKVTKIDAVVVDGQNLTGPFLKAGYWASRKTVVITWDLSRIPKAEAIPGVTFGLTATPDPDELADFIISSYQPYWRWWKDDVFDRIWERIDYPAQEPDAVEQKTLRANRSKIIEMLRAFNKSTPQRMVVARKAGRIIGMCDAAALSDDDNLDWGVLMMRDHPGKGFGKALLVPALEWLKSQGLTHATVTTTSGLDDFDPTVYLYAESCGGVIKGEFLNLVKRKFS